MAQADSFRFGIEVEFLMGSRNAASMTWDHLSREVAQRLAEAGISSKICETEDKSPERYSQWTITPEITVTGDPVNRLYGLEMVSPVYTPSSLWTDDLNTIFTTLQTHFRVLYSPKCGTHIHISRDPTPLASSARALAKAVLYFESALDTLISAVPPHTSVAALSSGVGTGTGIISTGLQIGSITKSHWAQSHRAEGPKGNPAFTDLTLAECLEKIDAAVSTTTTTTTTGATSTTTTTTIDNNNTATTHRIVTLLNSCSPTHPWALARGIKTPFIRGKTYKWDMTGLLSPANQKRRDARFGIPGTVEFRQPPGSGSAMDAVRWVLLGVAFVAGAVVVGEGVGMGMGKEKGVEEGGTLGELWGMLGVGVGVVGWDGGEFGVLGELFRRTGREGLWSGGEE